MRKMVSAIVAIAGSFAAAAAPFKVALIVQNHTSDAPILPLQALADTLTAKLSGKTLHVVNPHNVIGVNQNRTATGEVMPDASAQEIGRLLGTDGVLTASVLEFTGEDIHFEGKAVAHVLKIRMALNLADSATGETICGVEGEYKSKPYTALQVKSNTATLYEGIMHEAAAKRAGELLLRIEPKGWTPGAVKPLDVFFGCNVPGADIRIDGLSYGTCPAQLALTPGIHTVEVSSHPYFLNFKRTSVFNQKGQTYKVVLRLTPEGEGERDRAIEYETKLIALKTALLELEKRKNDSGVEYERKKLELESERKSIETEQIERCELFKKQLAFADVMTERYKLSGLVDDHVRKVIANGKAVYWENNAGHVAITDIDTDEIKVAAPPARLGAAPVLSNSLEFGRGLQSFLMKVIGQ